jgi:hypothetical protein
MQVACFHLLNIGSVLANTEERMTAWRRAHVEIVSEEDGQNHESSECCSARMQPYQPPTSSSTRRMPAGYAPTLP